MTAGELVEEPLISVSDDRVRERGQILIELDVGLELGELPPRAIDLAQLFILRLLLLLRLLLRRPGYGWLRLN